MNMIIFEKVENRVNEEDVILPKRGSKCSAGYDFYAPCDITVEPFKVSEQYFTDIKILLPENLFLSLHMRSSLGNKGLVLSNITGIIDADYYNNPKNEGNIGFKLRNMSDKPITIKRGERFMQGIIQPFYITTNDSTVNERSGGFGSTGKE